ncbi:MAG: hypothetical protein D3910_02405, partial [Candidatus Electrothrix sp. ATG2]|nr:hypothetical protein [Candidatus Electrothrix sp. ATG2]
MAKIEIPPFVKNMGSKLIAYILNISNENAGKLLNSDFELPQEKEKILCQFVEICREVRAKHIDNTNIDLHMLHDLFRQFIKGKHIFNILHEQAGGEKATFLECDDKVLQNLNKVFNKLYPLFLVNTTGWQQYFDVVLGDIGRASRDLPEGEHLYEEIKKDTVISSIVKQKSEQIGTHGYYKSSTGHGGSIQLISLPEMFLLNSFRLMRMREAFSLEAFSEAAEYTVNTFRRCTTGEAVEVPMFLGFNNISIDD